MTGGAARILGRHLAAFWREESGGPTVEFVLVVPFFFAFFLGSFEIGMLMVRQTFLDRGVDLAVREVLLNHFFSKSTGEDMLSHDTLRAAICERSLIIPNCNQRLKLEMVRIDPRDWSAMPENADCVDVGDPGAPVRSFRNPDENELTLVRACALFRPYVPLAGLGRSLDRQSGDFIAVFSTSAFVVEPR